MKTLFNKTVSLMIAVLMIIGMIPGFSVSLSADTVGSITWSFDDSTGTLTLGGSGEIGSTSDYNTPWNKYQEKITKVVIESGVTSIGDYAFYGCTNLTEVTIPDSVTSIGDYAFYECTNLTSVTIPDSVTTIGVQAFQDCTSLTNVDIPDSVTTIGVQAFYGTALTTVDIPDSVTSIGDLAFYGCEALSFAEIPCRGYDYIEYIFDTNTTVTVREHDFDANNECKVCGFSTIDGGTDENTGITWSYDKVTGTLTLSGSGSGEIGAISYMPWSGYQEEITNVVIEDGITSIGDYAFQKCSSLTNVTIGKGVTTIGVWAFGNTGLTNVDIPDSVTTIGDLAFACIGLTSVDIPDSVTTIGIQAFDYCEFLTSATIPCRFSDTVNDIFDTSVTTTVTVREHDFEDGECTVCGGTCETLGHDWNNGACTVCGGTCDTLGHDFDEDNKCKGCGILGGTYGSITWSYDTLTNTLTLGGSGEIGSTSDYNTPWNKYQEKITKVVIESGITSIGNFAFNNCTNLTSVTIPDSVTSIGDSAFQGCHSLIEVTIPDSVTTIGEWAFYYCESLTSVTIGNGVTTIGKYAFQECSSLTNVTIGKGVTTIGDNAFEGCYNLASIVIPDSVATIGNNAFNNCESLTSVTIGKGVITIGDSAFFYTGLTSVDIPDSVTTIGEWAFYGCSNLTNVDIPDSVTSIGIQAFGYCGFLSSAEIPCRFSNTVNDIFDKSDIVTVREHDFEDGECKVCEGTCDTLGHDFDEDGKCKGCGGTCETLGHDFDEYGKCKGCGILGGTDENTGITWSFDDSTGILTLSGSGEIGEIYYTPWGEYQYVITNVVIESGITTIGDSAFKGCYNLTSVTIPDSVTTIGAQAFIGCTALTSVTIPDGVTSIGEWAFYYCESLTSVTIGKGVTTIGEYAFDDCTNLTSVTIGKGVASIGDYAFYGTALTSVIIPDSVTSIGNFAFSHTGLTSVDIPDSVTAIGDDAFENCYNLTSVTIPDSVTSIGNFAFCGTGLTSVIIPDSVTSIGANAFYRTGLTSVDIPDSVTSIGSQAFDYCEFLSSAEIPCRDYGDVSWIFDPRVTTVTVREHDFEDGKCKVCGFSSIDGGTYDGSITWSYDTLTGILTLSGSGGIGSIYDDMPWGEKYQYEITKVVIEDGITSIGNSAFESCDNLASIVIPDSVTSIGDNAFNGCSNLTSVTVGNGVTSIGAQAFIGCTALTSVDIPDSVTSIGNYAFYECTNLTSVTIGNGVITIGNAAFDFCGALTSAEIPCRFSDTVDNIFDTDVTTVTVREHDFEDGKCKVCGISRIDGGTYDGSITWSYDKLTHTLTLSGSGSGEIGSIYDMPWGEYRKEITKVIIEDGIPYIGTSAFESCYNLTSINIPNNATSIGSQAFCNCTSLTSVTIPDSVTAIGYAAFYLCEALKAAEIPCRFSNTVNDIFDKSGIVTVREHDFEDGECTVCQTPCEHPSYADGACTVCGGTCETLGHDFDEYGKCKGCGIIRGTDDSITWSFDDSTGTLTLSGSGEIGSISEMPWGGYWDNIIKVVIEDGITSIGDGAFQDCHSLTEVTIPDSVTSIGNFAFCGTGLTSVIIPDSVTSIGANAFYACYNLSSAEIPCRFRNTVNKNFDPSVTTVTVREHDFDDGGNCSVCGKSHIDGGTYENITWSYAVLTDTLTLSGSGEIGWIYDMPWGEYQHVITKVVIESGITSIGDYAFQNCTSLTAVDIPDSVTYIGKTAFLGCRNLTSVTIPDSVTTIGDSAFSYTGLTAVDIPDSVTSIGAEAFYFCEALSSAGIPCRDYGDIEEIFDTNVTTVTVREHDFEDGECTVCQTPCEHPSYIDGACTVCGGTAPYIPGDITGDGKTNSNDAVAILRYLAGYDNQYTVEHGDYNGDGKTNSDDVVAILRMLAGYSD